MVSIKKMLREAIEEKDLEALEQIMKAVQENMPFGSAANLFEGVQEFRQQHERQMQLCKQQQKMRHCYFAKVGQGAEPKLADEHFCTVNRRFILPYRHPLNKAKSTMQDELEREKANVSESDSDDCSY